MFFSGTFHSTIFGCKRFQHLLFDFLVNSSRAIINKLSPLCISNFVFVLTDLLVAKGFKSSLIMSFKLVLQALSFSITFG